MLLKTAPIITNASGTLAGNVFQRDLSGLHLTAPPRHVKTSSPARRTTFNIFRTCSNAWSLHPWTPQELARWANYAVRHPHHNRLADPFIMTNRQAFLHVNLIRVRNDLTPTFIPPPD